MSELTIQRIKEVYDLCTKADCTSDIPLVELARELAVRKTTLMQFMLNHSKLFNGKETKKGLLISDVFLEANLNPLQPEYLERMKELWAHTLYVRQWDCYGHKEEFYLPVDTETDNPNYYLCYGLWRNTPEKLKSLTKGLHYHEGIGSIDLYSGTRLPYAVSLSEMCNLLTTWHLEGDLPSESELANIGLS